MANELETINTNNQVALVDYKLPTMTSKAKGGNYTLSLCGNEVILKRDVDFLKIPNTPRPSLMKAGAEKILLLFGLRVDVEIIYCERNFEKAFFYYEFKATAYDASGKAVRIGYGSANTGERNCTKGGYNEANATLKKAEKRAIVDLALKLGSCSDLFYQDLEDDNNAKGIEAMKPESNLSKEQLARLFTIASKGGLGTQETKDFLHKLGYASTKDIKVKDYDNVCEKLEEYIKKLGDVIDVQG
jgi:hypothetical protein